MEGDIRGRKASNSSSSSNDSLITTQAVEEDQEDINGDLRRGPWTVEEDFNLINYIASHGEGRWNSLARSAGLRRTGKSCRLRWLNYLRPDVRRGNITLEEQLMILELHSQWGNRWSKIAQHLPGRTDNEIKNYWRTRVQKHAKQLKCDVNSNQFKDAMRYLWMPRLMERIQAAAAAAPSSSSPTAPTTSNNTTPTSNVTPGGGNTNTSHLLINTINGGAVCGNPAMTPRGFVGNGSGSNNISGYTPDNSSASDSFDTHVSDLVPDYYNNNVAFTQSHNADYNFQPGQVGHYYSPSTNSPGGYCFNPGFDFQAMDQHTHHQWFDLGETSDNFWNADDIWLLQQQSNNNNNNNNNNNM